MAHPSLKVKTQASEEEVSKVAEELLAKVRPVVETRRQIKETYDEVVSLLQRTLLKLDELVALKNVNAEQEAKVLALLEAELNR